MNLKFRSICLGLLAMSMFCHSCSDNDEHNLSGEWHLNSISTQCEEGDFNEEMETYQSSDLSCVSLKITEIDDAYELSYTISMCQKLVFKEDDQLEVITENNGMKVTTLYSYSLEDDNIVVCPVVDDCITYLLENDKIVLTLELASQTGQMCNRTFIYEKE